MVERYRFYYRQDYSQWPQWLKEAWAKKSSLPGAFYPGWGAEDLRFFVATHTGPQEVNDGDVLAYSPETGEIQVEPASAHSPAVLGGGVLVNTPSTANSASPLEPRVIVGTGGDAIRL